MKRLFFTMVLALSFFNITAQQTTAVDRGITQNITGVIRDNITNEPLPGANIILMGSSPIIGTVSDGEGKFILKDVHVGPVSIKISFVGYSTVEILNRDLRTAKALNLDVFMDEMVLTGDEVVITAGFDKKASINTMSSVSTRTFSVDETRRYAGSRNDVARMASNYAGVQIADDSRNDIVVRGNSPAGMQYRLEGMEIANPNHFGSIGTSGGPVSILNNNQLANSDFLTSAFPAEYGNALSGVFDLQLRNGNANNHEFMAMVGFNGFEAGAEGPISKKTGASYIANYRYSTMELFELVGVSFGTGTAVPKYQDFSFKINLPTKKAGVFSLYGMGGKSNIEFLDSKRDSSDVDFYGGDGWDLRNSSELFIGGLNHIININKTAYIKTGLSFSHNRYTVQKDSIVPETKEIVHFYGSDFKENRIVFSSFLKKRVNIRNNFKIGINVNHYMSDLHDSVFRETQNQYHTLTSYEGSSNLIRPYISWQYKLSDKIVFNLGLDYMLYTFNSTSSLEPRFGVTYSATAKSKIGFAYGLHSQVLSPTTYNRESYIGQGNYVAMNTDLDLLKSNHFVLSYDWNITNFLRLKAETYYQDIYNAAVNSNKKDTYSTLNQGADFYIWTPDTLESTGTGKNYGIELTFEQFLNKGFYYLTTVSVFESKYKGSDGIERHTAFSSKFIANVLIGKEWELHKNSTNPKLTTKDRRLGIDVKVNYAGGRRYTPIDVEQSQIEHQPVYITDQTYDKQFPNYFRTDMKVYFKHGGKKANYEVGIDVQNIFNTQNIYSQEFNTSTGELYYNYQLGIMVIPYFRFEF